jgi:hypothetical protein
VASVVAWIAVVIWVLALKGTRWADSAANAGLAWILLTGGGYFAEQAVRSFVEMWGRFPRRRGGARLAGGRNRWDEKALTGLMGVPFSYELHSRRKQR